MRVFKSTAALVALFGAALLATNNGVDGISTPAAKCTSGLCCNLLTGVPHPSGRVCRPPCGDCDLAEVCDGTSPTCPTDKVMESTVVCRPAGGECDEEEKCPGNSASTATKYYCPADAKKKSTVTCRAKPDKAECEDDAKCDGSSDTCPPRVFKPPTQSCRGSSGNACDPEEFCTGSSPFCPPDVQSDGCSCAKSPYTAPPACGVYQCSKGTCSLVAKPKGTLCSVGSLSSCTGDAYCDGTATTCPTAALATGTVCSFPKGVCDVTKTCKADGKCTADGAPNTRICREAVGDCDVAEYCNSATSPHCPADKKKSAGTSCRASIGECDKEEKCDGKTGYCPTDVYESAGKSCTYPLTANEGLGNAECDAPDTCAGSTPFCVDNRYECYEGSAPDQPTSAASYSMAALMEAESSALFHPIAIVPRPVSEHTEGEKASVSGSGSFRSSTGRRD